MTVGDRSDWDRSLSFALRARATELAVGLPADAVEAALLAALGTATADGRWGDVAQLASELEARETHRRGSRPPRAKRAGAKAPF